VNHESTETVVIVEPNFVIEAVLDDKLEYNDARLLSNSQHKLIKTLKDNNEKQR